MTRMRWLMRLGMGLAGLIAGVVWSGCRVPLYGAELMYMPAPPRHDPTVTIADFSYTPASPVRPGVSIEFSATTSKPTNAGYMRVFIGNPPGLFFALYDNGYAPDALAADGIWSGEWIVPEDAQPGSLPVTVQLDWWDGFDGLELSGSPLTIVEEEDNSQ